MVDVKAKVEALVKKITTDKDFAAKFQKNPVSAVEELLGIALPDDQIQAIISGVKTKINLDSLGKIIDSDGDGKPDLGGLSSLLGKK